jgi:hypothetical protein
MYGYYVERCISSSPRNAILMPFIWRLAKCGVLPLVVTSVLVAQQSARPVANGAGSPDPCLRRSIPVTFIKNIPTAPPMRLQDLQVAVKGDPASIISLVGDEGTRRVILLIDTSGSMGLPEGRRGWGIGLQVAKFAADAIPPGAPVALGTFSEHLQVSEFPDGNGLSKPLLALGKLQPYHRTALYDVVSNASSLFKTPQFGDAIYVVTDGTDNHSSIRLPQLENELIAHGVRVFVFLVTNEFRTPEERQAPDDMAELARKTGGGLISLPWSEKWFTKPEAASLAKSIREQVAAPNRMELQLTNPLYKPGKLSVTLASGAKKAYTVVYPRLLEPCSTRARQ